MMPRFFGGKKGQDKPQKELKIQHTTYDDIRTNQASRPVTSSSQSHASASSSRPRSRETSETEQPSTPWTTYVNEKYPEIRDSYPRANYIIEQPPPHPLRRKGKLPDLPTGFNKPLSSGRLDEYHRIQRDTHAGSLEVGLPRNEETRSTPPRPNSWTKRGFNPFTSSAAVGPEELSPPYSPRPTKQGVSLAQRLSAGAASLNDAMVEVSEQLTSDVKSSLARSCFSLARRESADSDELFMCQGEGESSTTRERETNATALAAWKQEQEVERDAKPRGFQREHRPPPLRMDGSRSPYAPKLCKRCQKPGLKGLRSLCYPCEQFLKRPQHPPPVSAVGGGGNFPSDYLEERGPTPPPKDYPLHLRKDAKPTPPLKDFPRRGASKSSGEASHPSPTAELTFARVIPQQPQIHDEYRGRHISLYVEVEEGEAQEEEEEEVESWRRWQTGSQRAEFDRVQNACGKWDDWYENGEEVAVDDEEVVGEDKEEKKKQA